MAWAAYWTANGIPRPTQTAIDRKIAGGCARPWTSDLALNEAWSAIHDSGKDILCSDGRFPSFTDGATLPGVYTVYARNASGNVSLASNSWQLGVSVPSLALPGRAALAVILLLGASWALRRRAAARAHH